MPGRNNAMVMSVAALRGRRLAVARPTVTGARLAIALWDGDDVVAASLPARLGELHFMPHQGTLVRWSDDDWVFGFFNGNGWATFREAKLLGIFPYVEHSEFPRTGYARHGKRLRTWVAARPVESGRSLSVVSDTFLVLFGGETCTLVSWHWRGGRLQQARAGGSGLAHVGGRPRRPAGAVETAPPDATPTLAPTSETTETHDHQDRNRDRIHRNQQSLLRGTAAIRKISDAELAAAHDTTAPSKTT